jgi:hypothetical protein
MRQNICLVVLVLLIPSVAGAEAPGADWAAIRMRFNEGITIRTRTAGTIRGRLVGLQPDALVVKGWRPTPTKIDGADVCSVSTYPPESGRDAKYAAAFGLIGVGLGVLDWFGRALGDQPSVHLGPKVLQWGIPAAMVGAGVAHGTQRPHVSKLLYVSDDRTGCH